MIKSIFVYIKQIYKGNSDKHFDKQFELKTQPKYAKHPY